MITIITISIVITITITIASMIKVITTVKIMIPTIMPFFAGRPQNKCWLHAGSPWKTRSPRPLRGVSDYLRWLGWFLGIGESNNDSNNNSSNNDNNNKHNDTNKNKKTNENTLLVLWGRFWRFGKLWAVLETRVPLRVRFFRVPY